MENLPIPRVRRASDEALVLRRVQILNVRQDHGRGLPLVGGILATANGGNVGGDPGVDYQIFFAGMFVDLDTADDEEAMAAVQFFRQSTKFGVEGREGKSSGRDVPKREVQRCEDRRLLVRYTHRHPKL